MPSTYEQGSVEVYLDELLKEQGMTLTELARRIKSDTSERFHPQNGQSKGHTFLNVVGNLSRAGVPTGRSIAVRVQRRRRRALNFSGWCRESMRPV